MLEFFQLAVFSLEAMMSESTAQYDRRQRVPVIVRHLSMPDAPVSG
jgi:hypothetical protein